MAATTRLVGLILAVLGIASYLGTGRTSWTALIPAILGVVFLVLAYVARNEAARKHAMHVALLVALVGIAGTAQRVIGATDFTRPATLAQIATVVVLAWFLAKGIKSFRDARRARA
jgi:uncharacterized membrane protein